MKRKQCVAYVAKIHKGSQVLIPQGDIKFLYGESFDKSPKQFAIRSPLTHEWAVFDVPIDHIKQGCFTAEINEFTDYYKDMARILEHSRDIQPMKNDLTPWDEDECRLFGLRNPKYDFRKLAKRIFNAGNGEY